MSGITLQKGTGVSLSKRVPNLRVVRVGLGWDVRETPGAPFDLDASVFMLTDHGRVRGDQDFIFYNQLTSPDGAIQHMGDNRTGVGEGDDEVIKIDLTRVSSDITRTRVAVSIHEAESRGQSFGMVNSAFIRIVNDETNEEIARYNLTHQASSEAAMIFGELYLEGGEWKFGATGHPVGGGLLGLASTCGVNVGGAPPSQPTSTASQSRDLGDDQADEDDDLPDFKFEYEERTD